MGAAGTTKLLKQQTYGKKLVSQCFAVLHFVLEIPVLATILFAVRTLLWYDNPPGKRMSLPEVARFTHVQLEQTIAIIATIRP